MYLSTSNILQKDDSINTTLNLPPLLNFDFNHSIPVLSPDNSFVIFYNDSIILNVDLKTKKVKWYQKFENNEKISKVQINSMNQISFIKKLYTHNEIVILSNNNFMDYNELKIKENILEYKLFQNSNSNDSSDMILVVNDYFQISLYKDNILQKSVSNNIINDIQNDLIHHNNKILHIEYIDEQNLILFFIDNGLIVIYSIGNYNSENINSNEEIIEYKHFINLNSNEDNQYIYYNLNIHRNSYVCVNHIRNHSHKDDNMILENDNSDKNSSSENNYITTFLTICANQKAFNKRKSSIYFFRIENSKFISINGNDIDMEEEQNINNINNNITYNKINFENKEIMDSSIFKYKIKNDENDMSDYIFILFKNCNNINNNKFLYSTEYSNLFHWFNLDKENNNNNENNKFEIFEIFEDFSNSHIYINNINLTQKKRKIFTVSYCKLGEKIISIEHNNENLNSEENKNMNELLNSNNYNDYLKQLNSINFSQEDFNKSILNKYKNLYEIDLEEGLDDFSKDDCNKINYFILNLIANQSLFKIKNYILKRNVLNSGFIFPIEHICLTCKFLLKQIKNKLKKDNKKNIVIEKLLNILVHILKIVQNRNRTYKDKLFGGEKEIMIEQESNINSIIFDAECILYILKIQNLYYDLLSDDNEIELINKNYGNLFFNIFSLKKSEKNEDIKISNSDIEDNFNENILDNLKELHTIYFDLFSEKKLKNLFNPNFGNPITLDALLYYIKFVIYNHYFYCVFPKELKNINKHLISIDEKDLCQSKYFKKILPELKNYFQISKTIYILDYMEGNKLEINLNNLIKFLQYISNERLIMNEKINKILPMNKIIYKFIKNLYDMKYYNEAFDVGNSLFSFLSNFDEFNLYLYTILQLKDYPLAYSFINNCLLLYYQKGDNEDKIRKFLESNMYYEIKNIYINFYIYLIENKAIDVLFKIPLNFIEIYIFKEMCEENEKYKEFLIIYYIMIGNANEAKYYFQKYLNTDGVNESQSKILYANLIKYYEALFNRKHKNEKIDEIIIKLAEENKFLLNIDNEEEKRLINNRKNINSQKYFNFSKSLLQSSIMENKIISGMNYNAEDYNKISADLISKLSSSFNKNLSSKFLSIENIKKINLNSIKPFSNDQISSTKYTNSNMNLISNKI